MKFSLLLAALLFVTLCATSRVSAQSGQCWQTPLAYYPCDSCVGGARYVNHCQPGFTIGYSTCNPTAFSIPCQGTYGDGGACYGEIVVARGYGNCGMERTVKVNVLVLDSQGVYRSREITLSLSSSETEAMGS